MVINFIIKYKEKTQLHIKPSPWGKNAVLPPDKHKKKTGKNTIIAAVAL